MRCMNQAWLVIICRGFFSTWHFLNLLTNDTNAFDFCRKTFRWLKSYCIKSILLFICLCHYSCGRSNTNNLWITYLQNLKSKNSLTLFASIVLATDDDITFLAFWLLMSFASSGIFIRQLWAIGRIDSYLFQRVLFFQ